MLSNDWMVSPGDMHQWQGWGWAAGIGDKEGAESEGSLGAGDAEWAEGLPRHLRGPGSIICVHVRVRATS